MNCYNPYQWSLLKIVEETKITMVELNSWAEDQEKKPKLAFPCRLPGKLGEKDFSQGDW